MNVLTTGSVDIAYELAKIDEAKGTIVFFNGIMSTLSSWQPYAIVCQDHGFSTLTHDFRGQLMSGKPEDVITFDQHSNDAKLFFDKFELGPVHLVGTSYGGIAAIKFTLDYPDLVRSLTLIDSLSETDDYFQSWVSNFKLWAQQIIDASDFDRNKNKTLFMKNMIPMIYSNRMINKDKTILSERIEAFSAMSIDYFCALIKLFDNTLENTKFSGQLAKIKCPTLVICGDEDRLTPQKFSKIIHENISGSELVLIPEGGHALAYEKPEILLSLLLGFFLIH